MSAQAVLSGHRLRVGLMAGLIVAAFCLGRVQAATVTGEWDFHADDLSATMGNPLEYLDGTSGDTASATEFGTASSFGLPLAGAKDVHVMRIPFRAEWMGYAMYPGIQGNGGGRYVNQYTMVMDLYCPAKTLETSKALYNASSTNSNDAEMYIDNGQLGVDTSYDGVVNSDTWHRLAWTVNGTTMKKYIDGVLVGTQSLDSIDGRWSLYTASDGNPTILFNDSTGDPTVFYVSFIEIYDGVLSDSEVLDLGGPAGTPGFIVLPYLQNVKTDGITIMWELNRDTACSVEYGVSASDEASTPCSVAVSDDGTYIYKAVVTGLTPGTTYHYRPVVDGVTSAEGTFKTAPADEEDFRFGYWSDSQGAVTGTSDPYEPTNSIFKHMVSRGIDFAVGGGDLTENGSDIFDTRRFCLDRLEKYVGQYVPWFVAWGNHDSYDLSWNSVTYETFVREFADMPSKDRPGLSAGVGSFSFNYSGCHFICIDDSRRQTDITNGWLLHDLQSHESQSARFRFLFVHRPPYCDLWYNGEPFFRQYLVPLLEQYKVSVCFSGHTHEHERGEQNGVQYIISGGASWLDTGEPLVYDWPFITVGGYHTMPGAVKGGCLHNYLEISVTGNLCTVTMHAFNPDGSYRGIADTVSFMSPTETTRGWFLY